MKELAATLLALAAGCSTTTDTAFHVSGRVDSKTVTHVVATTPSHIATSRIAAQVDGDGGFELALDPGYAWVLSFANSRQVGMQMLEGTLQAGSLDALVPRAAGSLDLGTITMQAGFARATVAWSDVTSALGIDDATGEHLGAADDLATRYANPDMDNDGVLDALQADHDFRLDLTGTLRVTIGGRDASIDDLVRNQMTGDVGVHYLETGIVASMPAAFAGQMSGATITFGDTFYGSSLGAATPATPAGTAIGEPELKVGRVDGTPTLGVFASPGHDVPAGQYDITIGDQVVSFGDVRPSGDAQLAAGRNLVVPFMQLVPTEADCVSDCQIKSIGYTWMRSTADGWVPATAGELTRPAHLDIVRAHAGSTQALGVDMPATPNAQIEWAAMPMAKGMVPNDLAGITTSELCYFSVTYDDQVGMKLTSLISNPDPACSPM